LVNMERHRINHHSPIAHTPRAIASIQAGYLQTTPGPEKRPSC
jgi:hypothetical protein